MSIVYFHEKQEQPYENFQNPFNEKVIYPVGLIKEENSEKVKQINGFIKEMDSNVIVLSFGKNTNDSVEIMYTEEKAPFYKASLLSEGSRTDIENVWTREEINNLKKEGTYINVFVDELSREDTQISYFATSIVFFEK